jgi:hypothetical protein
VEVTVESEHEMQRLIQVVDTWNNIWSLRGNAKKSGIMHIRAQPEAPIANPVPIFRLQGNPLPIVSEYKYLGIMLTKEALECVGRASTHVNFYKRMIEDSAQRVEKATYKIQRTLCNPDLPLRWRVDAFNTLVASTVAYGAGLYGATRFASPVQTALNMGIRLMLGLTRRYNVTSMEAARVELAIEHHATQAAVERARVFLKAEQEGKEGKESALSWLIQNPNQGKRGAPRTHSAISRTWIQNPERFEAIKFLHGHEAKVKLLRKNEKKALRLKRVIRWVNGKPTRFNNRGRYYEERLYQTRGYIDLAARIAEIARGSTLLLKARIKAYPSVQYCKDARIPFPAAWNKKCPFCSQPGTCDSIRHVLLECTRWANQRARFINPILKEEKMLPQKVKDNPNLLTLFLLGGFQEKKGIKPNRWKHKWLHQDIVSRSPLLLIRANQEDLSPPEEEHRNWEDLRADIMNIPTAPEDYVEDHSLSTDEDEEGFPLPENFLEMMRPQVLPGDEDIEIPDADQAEDVQVSDHEVTVIGAPWARIARFLQIIDGERRAYLSRGFQLWYAQRALTYKAKDSKKRVSVRINPFL